MQSSKRAGAVVGDEKPGRERKRPFRGVKKFLLAPEPFIAQLRLLYLRHISFYEWVFPNRHAGPSLGAMKENAALPAPGIEQGVMVFAMDGMAPETGLRKVKAAIERFRLLRRGLRSSNPKNAIPGSSKRTAGSSSGSLGRTWRAGGSPPDWRTP